MAGGKVLITPDVTPVPVSPLPDDLARQFPPVFAACAVNRSSYKRENEFGLSNRFFFFVTVGTRLSRLVVRKLAFPRTWIN